MIQLLYKIKLSNRLNLNGFVALFVVFFVSVFCSVGQQVITIGGRDVVIENNRSPYSEIGRAHV